jgi:hypothetical protein
MVCAAGGFVLLTRDQACTILDRRKALTEVTGPAEPSLSCREDGREFFWANWESDDDIPTLPRRPRHARLVTMAELRASGWVRMPAPLSLRWSSLVPLGGVLRW